MEEINKRIYYLHSQIDLLHGSSTLSCFSISMAKSRQNGRDQTRKTCSW